MRGTKEPFEVRWAAQNKPRGVDECWPWGGGISDEGYGTIHYKGRQSKAHRVAWELHSGEPIPKGKYVCHHCDNRKCVNPKHLYIGTHADNMEDKVKRCRAGKKLTPQQAIEIREATGTNLAIAKKYGLNQENVRLIRNGTIWRGAVSQEGGEVNELSELRKRAEAFRYQYTLTDQSQELPLIEQALLAERRLALETMAIWFLTTGHEQQAEWYSDEVANALRAAAEKEGL